MYTGRVGFVGCVSRHMWWDVVGVDSVACDDRCETVRRGVFPC